MTINTALHTLITRHALDLLLAQGWPEHTDVSLPAPSRWPGWVAVCVRLEADDLATLLTRLSGQAELPVPQQQIMAAAITKLEGSQAVMVLLPEHGTEPMVPGDDTGVRFPYASEWLTEPEIAAVLACLRQAVRRVCIQIADDARKIQAAVTPSTTHGRLFTRRIGHFQLVADESDDDSLLDECAPEEVKRVLDAIMNDGARYGAVRLVVSSNTMSVILAYGLVTDVLRYPGVPARRWMDYDLLHDVICQAREEVLSVLNAHRSFLNKL
ncbi:hypothetical protein KX75_20385 [Salmonella enterica subsp. enterica]|nr:hypothetical protein [Salmonella enterica subsp. enterica serovar Mikawasima]EDN7229229.1 hypothetical protein [Salmonella enterica subsp. enterica serovar Mikawasima]